MDARQVAATHDTLQAPDPAKVKGRPLPVGVGAPAPAPFPNPAPARPVTPPKKPILPPASNAAALAHDPAVLQPGDELENGRYTVLSVLGRGGMGIVYRVRDNSMRGKEFAMKALAQPYASDPDAVESVKAEVLTAQGLQHPNILVVYDIVETGGAVLIKMELVDGDSLSELSRRAKGPLPVETVVEWMRQAAEGFQYAHNQNVIHADIKPANLMLTKSGLIKIADFGLAVVLDQHHTHLSMKGVVAGTPYYMSPEQYRGVRVSKLSDIYSLGATMYALLNGKAPFRGAGLDHQVLHVMPPPIASVPSWLNDLVLRCMAKVDSDRPATMADVAEVLCKSQTNSKSVAVPVATHETTVGRRPSQSGVFIGGTIQLPSGAFHPPVQVDRDFALIGVESFSCPNDLEGPRIYSASVYRNERLAKALGLRLSERTLDTEFIMLPHDGKSTTFVMGAPVGEPGRRDDESPHKVLIAHLFLIARCPVTQRVYEALGGSSGRSRIRGEFLPVTHISRTEAMIWCRANGLRLPSEAEWEFACRGGTQSPFFTGSKHPSDGFLIVDAQRMPLPVGKTMANAYGLFDMQSNVREWVSDSYSPDFAGAPEDGSPLLLIGYPLHVGRGASWHDEPNAARSAARIALDASVRDEWLGFRPAYSVSL